MSYVVKLCEGGSDNYVRLHEGGCRSWVVRRDATRFATKAEAVSCRNLVVSNGIYARDELKIVRLVPKCRA